MNDVAHDDNVCRNHVGVDDKRRLPQLHDVVDVWWDDRDLIFRGKLGGSVGSASSKSSRKPRRQFRFTIYYDDGDVFVHDLNRMTWRYVDIVRKECGKWIQPGELEHRSIRAFKASQGSPQSGSFTNSQRSSSKRNRPASAEVHGQLQPCVKVQMTDRHMSPRSESSDPELQSEKVGRNDSRDMDMKENESGKKKEKKSVKDEEKHVLEALLLLSDNSNLGLIPSSPVPYRKRHHVRYISSIPTH